MWYAWHQSMTTCMNELFSHGHSLLAMAFSRPWTLEYGVQYTRPVSGPRRRGARPSRRGPSHVRLAACLGRSARRAKRRHQHTCGYAVATYTCAPLSRRTRERAQRARTPPPRRPPHTTVAVALGVVASAMPPGSADPVRASDMRAPRSRGGTRRGVALLRPVTSPAWQLASDFWRGWPRFCCGTSHCTRRKVYAAAATARAAVRREESGGGLPPWLSPLLPPPPGSGARWCGGWNRCLN